MKIPVGQIVEGHVNEILGLNTNLSENRLLICRQCPLYSDKFGGICNSKLWLDPETGKVASQPRDGYIQGCGCRLLAKTTLPNAKCVAGKW